MKKNHCRLHILILAHATLSFFPLHAQENVYQINDHVELPAALELPGDSSCYLEFREEWTFLARGSLIKDVFSQEITCSGEQKDMPQTHGGLRIKDISYEFYLLDPHLTESGNIAFSGPDSMDIPTRDLQASLIELIRTYAPIDPLYHPDKHILSVYFHEEWKVDPNAGQITKKVKAITPVIWQRRQTAEGQSIDEGDSGLPVYYKTSLQKISLRQP